MESKHYIYKKSLHILTIKMIGKWSAQSTSEAE